MKRAWVNLTTSRVTSRLMGIKLLYRMMNVSRLYAKLVEMSPAQTQTHNANDYISVLCLVMGVSVCIPTSTGQVPAGVFSVFSVPDGGPHRADQRHHQQDAEQNQDLHVGHPLHVWALQRRLGGVLERRLVNARHVEAEDTRWDGKMLCLWTASSIPPASVWSHGPCRQQFPQPTGCFWAGHRAATPGLDLKELDWRRQDVKVNAK